MKTIFEVKDAEKQLKYKENKQKEEKLNYERI